MRLTLTKRYVIFLAGVIFALLTVSYFVTASIMRDGLSDLFRRRLERGRAVLEQYARVDFYSRRTELETLLSSPRFVAAVATGDEGTIAHEAPAYQSLSGADLFMVTDPERQVLYSGDAPRELVKSATSKVVKNSDNISPAFILDGTNLVEILTGPILTADGLLIGYLIVGHRVQSYMPEELQQLTGFDVLVTHSNKVVGRTPSVLTERLVADPTLVSEMVHHVNRAEEITVGNEKVLYYTIPHHSASVTFVAPIETHISPILKSISGYLALVTVIGGLMAVAAMWFFTHRRIGRQVNLLVGAAQRMAKDDFDFEIVPASRDELGYLAGEFERARERIVANRAQLEEAHESQVKSERLAAVGSLTAGIVHDIKNPMAVIRGTADLIRHQSQGNEKILRKCETIENQIERVNELTRDLLEYSRGKTKLELEQTRLSDYFRQIAEQHHVPYERSGIALKYTGGGDIIARIDPVRFRRVIDNLLNNAREALKPGNTVSISWGVNGDVLTITVADDGPGIPANILQSLFDPFVTQGKESGTGLGLAIARKIVEDHGGSIAVTSAPDNGASFTIDLPPTIVIASGPKQHSTTGVPQ